MLEWLRGERRPEGLPEYSAIRSTPTRGLPSELVATEGGEKFAARQQALSDELCGSPHRPPDDEPLLIAFMDEKRTGFLTVNGPDDGQRCVPVFSASWRAADYRRVLFSSRPAILECPLTPEGFIKILRDLNGIGVSTFAIDRCPRCTIFPAFGGSSMRTPGDVIRVWAIHKAAEILRAELYLAYASELARRGRLDAARDVALETVGHVTMENPRAHFLLGQLAVGLDDRPLLREAATCLRAFGFEQWMDKLGRVVRSGSPDFAEPA